MIAAIIATIKKTTQIMFNATFEYFLELFSLIYYFCFHSRTFCQTCHFIQQFH